MGAYPPRCGELFVFADTEAKVALNDNRRYLMKVASDDHLIAPAVFTVPLQPHAYHVSVLRGTM